MMSLVRKWFSRLPASLIYHEHRIITSRLSAEQATTRLSGITVSDLDNWLKPQPGKIFTGTVDGPRFAIRLRDRQVAEEQVMETQGILRPTKDGCELLLTHSYGFSTVMWLIGILASLGFFLFTFSLHGFGPLVIGGFFLIFTIGGYFSYFGQLLHEADRASEILYVALLPTPPESD